MSVILEYPVTYLKLHAKGMLVELFGVERDHYTRFAYGSWTMDHAEGGVTDAATHGAIVQHPSAVRELIRLPVLLTQAAIYPMLLLGVVQLARRRRWLLVAGLLLPAIYILLLSGGPEASPRFRVLYTPLLAVAVGVGLRAAWVWLTSFAKGPLHPVILPAPTVPIRPAVAMRLWRAWRETVSEELPVEGEACGGRRAA
jgi:hypothetical protein